MKHLQETGLTYIEHLYRAWTLAFVCLVHGLFPSVWQHKAKDIINSDPKEFRR